MDVHHHHHHNQNPYGQSDGHAQAYAPSHSYDTYYAAYSHAPYEASSSASASAYSHLYYDYSASYQQPPPPPGVDPSQHHYAAAPTDRMEPAAYSHSSEYAVPIDAAQGSGSGRGQFRGRGGRRGGRGGFGRGNFRGRGRGRGGGRGQEPAQPPAPKPARQPKPHAWCDICRVDCNSLEILEQHKAGKRHKRTVQRIQEYEAQQKQLAGYQSTVVVSSTNSETAPSVADSVPQTLPAPCAVSVTAVANEASTSNPPTKMKISEEHNKETGALNQPITEGPSETVKTESSGTQAPPPSETNLAEAAPSGKQPFPKRPRPDGYGLGFMYGFGGDRFDRGGRRGRWVDRGGKRPRRFGEFQPWPPMPMPMPMMHPYPMMPPVSTPGPASHVPRVRPIVCTLCNVTCDTPAVFETHVSGKKHRNHISKFQSPNTVFGPITVYIPPGQPTPYPQNGPEPVFYGLTTPELIQQHEMLMRDMEDDDEEEEDADDDSQNEGNPEDGAEDDGQDEETADNGTNDVSNAAESIEQNESVMEPTSGSTGHAVPGSQINAEVSVEAVMGEK